MPDCILQPHSDCPHLGRGALDVCSEWQITSTDSPPSPAVTIWQEICMAQFHESTMLVAPAASASQRTSNRVWVPSVQNMDSHGESPARTPQTISRALRFTKASVCHKSMTIATETCFHMQSRHPWRSLLALSQGLSTGISTGGKHP